VPTLGTNEDERKRILHPDALVLHIYPWRSHKFFALSISSRRMAWPLVAIACFLVRTNTRTIAGTF
jgi:hypothetical protein